jgi:hypothetical protein
VVEDLVDRTGRATERMTTQVERIRSEATGFLAAMRR